MKFSDVLEYLFSRFELISIDYYSDERIACVNIKRYGTFVVFVIGELRYIISPVLGNISSFTVNLEDPKSDQKIYDWIAATRCL